MDSASSVCCFCGELTHRIGPSNGTGFWVHGVPGAVGFIYCKGKNTRAQREHYKVGDPPVHPWGNDGIDTPVRVLPQFPKGNDLVPHPDDCECGKCIGKPRYGPKIPEVGPLLEKILERQEAVQNLWDSGLIWLINTSILHPRGYALSAVFDYEDPNKVIGLTVVGDGSEPWCFGTTGGDGEGYSGKFKTYESDDSYRRHCEAEQKREMVWSEKLTHPLVKIEQPRTCSSYCWSTGHCDGACGRSFLHPPLVT